MKWISALDLEQWADRVGARTGFPELIRDLIFASVRDISDIRFPGGDKGQVPGFDGWLDAVGEPPFVPVGRSIWEFGVSEKPAGKFADDYDNRLQKLGATERQQITFVFATPRTWTNPKTTLPDFVKEYRERKDFADVKYLDGVQIEGWLEQCSAVGARHARTVCGWVPQMGARSTDEFWDEYAKRFRPALTEDVVLCARTSQAEEIVTHLLGKPGPLVFMADGPDEVSAVAVAAIRKAPTESRTFLEARTLIIDTEEAGRRLSVPDRYGYVVSPNANKISGRLSGFGPTVSGLGLGGSHQAYPRLNRPSTRDMTEALRTMGFTETDASLLAIKSGRSLSILERQVPAASFSRPQWVSEGTTLLPTLLAGGWNSRHTGDMTIITELAGGGDYHQIEALFRQFLDRHDAPLDREAGIWKLRAPVDAFVNLSSLLGAEHLALLRSVVTRIFTAPPPDIGEERFAMSKAPFSFWLREGVANTLLMMAALHQEVALDVGQDPAQFVKGLVADLPGLRDDYRVIMSLDQQLPALMEAAPDPLLSALEQMLEGNPGQFAPVFVDPLSFGGSRSPLPNLLWALELLAWDPDYLLRVSLVLARLADMDPGGRSGNRPINSLRDIFVAWLPGTNAPLAARLAAIDALVRQSPATGWALLIQLLPKNGDVKSPTQRPKFREAGASDREVLTNVVVGDTYNAITDRVLTLLGETSGRWLSALSAFPNFSIERMTHFLDLLQDHASRVSGDDKVVLRRAIRGIADRHARFRDAAWALPEGQHQRLTAIGQSIESKDLMDQAISLFDEWSPRYASNFAEAEQQVAKRRQQAVARLSAAEGTAAVLELAVKVKHAGLVAAACAEGIEDEGLLVDILVQAAANPAAESFAIAIASALRWERGEVFDPQFLTIAHQHGWTNSQIAVLLLNWPEVPSTWTLVEAVGEEAKEIFWRRRDPGRFRGPSHELCTLVNYFLEAGRAGAALQVLYDRENDLDWPTISRILDMRVRELNALGDRADLDSYYIEELFEKLRQRTDVPRMDLAQWEYVYFPALEHRDNDLILFDCMASDPELYVSILKDAFIEDGTNPDDQVATDEERARANAAHRILIAFNKTPAQHNGVVNGDELNSWVSGMIEEARKARRLNVVYSYIGRSLAHSAEEDGVWPQAAVAEVIERLQSEDIERGLMIERFNMRGVYMKAMFEGGKQERELAKQYRDWSARLSASQIRTKALLNAIAKSWENDAKQADEAAARDKLRFE